MIHTLIADMAAGEFMLTPQQLLGIPVALIGAVLLAFGAQYQFRGLNKVERLTGSSVSSGLSLKQLRGLVSRPSWVIGTLLLVIAVAFQLVSLSLAPLLVVQPLGAAALVVTALLNSRLSRVTLGRRATWAIIWCVAGVSVFVTVAAFNATDKPVTDAKLLTILALFGVVLVAAISLYLLFRRRALAFIYITGAGVLYGFVATFAKAVIGRFQQGEFEWLTWLCVLALIAGTLLGMLFVQNAYSSGPPDLVVAGLTVIDPLIAVLIGVVVLGEATYAQGWAGAVFIASGALAVYGVAQLAKFHPQSSINLVMASGTGSIPLPPQTGNNR